MNTSILTQTYNVQCMYIHYTEDNVERRMLNNAFGVLLGHLEPFIFAFEQERIIHMYIHSWKKIGILATGCRRLGVKNDVKLQKKIIVNNQLYIHIHVCRHC